MNNETLIKSFSSYDVFKREADNEGFVHLTDNDILFCKMSLYTLGNIWSYAAKNDRDIDVVYKNAIKTKSPLRWIKKQSSVLSDIKSDKMKVINIYDGMIVIYMGKELEICTDSNNNFRFVEA